MNERIPRPKVDTRLWWRVEPTTGRWFRWMWTYGEGLMRVGNGGVTHRRETAVRKAQRAVKRLQQERDRQATLGDALRWREGE